MKIECPVCSTKVNIDENTVPNLDQQFTCARCGNIFNLLPQRSGVDIIQNRERMICSKCGSEQPLAEMCAICGISIKKYLQTKVRKQDIERLEFVKLRSEVREVDAWYKNLIDRRASSLIVRVLSLLILMWVFMTCSMNNAKNNRFIAENTEEMRRSTENSKVNVTPERNDNDFKDKFGTAINLMISMTDACLSQNYSYKMTWYQNAQPYFLTENLADNLATLKRQKHGADAAFSSLPVPSHKYFDCYVKVRLLSNLQNQVCGLANAYTTHHYDFSERLSNISFELSKLRGELYACNESYK